MRKPQVVLFSAALIALATMPVTANAALVISKGATSNVNCAAGVCTATAKKAVLNATDLENMLESGDASVSSGSSAKDISINAAVGWTSASRLTLASYRSITFQDPVSVRGSGALTLTTDAGSANGDLRFARKGRVIFWDTGASLIINENTYTLVSKFSQLVKLVTSDPSGHYALARNFKVRTKPFRRSPIDVTFAGVLEGLGNTIQGLSLSPFKGSAGMITTISTGGVVRDLSLTNVAIVANAGRYGEITSVGAIAGVSNGTIDGVNVDGTFSALNNYDAHFGMIAGDGMGPGIYLSASGTMKIGDGNNSAGGLFGSLLNYRGDTLSWSHASVDITNGDFTGGLVGSGDGFIVNCYATGNVTGGQTGGLIGSIQGTVESSFATGAVNGSAGGGLVGGTDGGNSIIRNSYSTGAVTAHGDAGGLIGLNIGNLDRVYSTGPLTETGTTRPGGLIGFDDAGTTTAGFWNMDTSGVGNSSQGAGNIANDPGITGLTDAQLKSGLPSGFDPAIWGQSAGINNGYPYLLANPPPQ